MSRGRTAQTEEPVPESDRLEGCEHPRAQQYLFGHQRATQMLADAARRAALPHAVLISGPKGVGKATLAWRLTRALMGQGRGKISDDLGMPSAVPAAGLIEKLSHPDIMLLRRLWDDRAKKFGAEIPVDEVRRLSAFLGRHSAQGGWRIAIIDAADDLSRGAENALLKTLEEPPAKALIILVSHAPGSLLPTTRSRCWHIALRPLEQEEMEHALRTLKVTASEGDDALLGVLAEGSPGKALGLLRNGGLATARETLRLWARLDRPDLGAICTLADRLAKPQADAQFSVFLDTYRKLLWGTARACAGEVYALRAFGAGSADLERIGVSGRLEEWTGLWDKLGQSVQRADALNLDKRHLIVSLLLDAQAVLRA